MSKKNIIELDKLVVKFVGDSGDGMQLTGTQFTETSAIFGNDVSTFPNYPAEIRAPLGTIGGVSGFQVQIGSVEIHTPGDVVDIMVAMNPAALKANLENVGAGKTIIVDSDSFIKKNLKKAGYESNPLEDGSLEGYNVVEAPITTLTEDALTPLGVDKKSIGRSRNMFALGMISWLVSRPLDHTEAFLKKKFKSKPMVVEANLKALKTGYFYAETIQALPAAYTVFPAAKKKGTYRNIMGNQATAWGFLAAAKKANLQLFLGSYPITPASDILHELVKHIHLGAVSFQAEDEIAGIVSTIGASFAGNLAITTTSGPGLALKGEAMGLAVMAELPIVIVNVQRGGPSTGLPTKTEQSDLMQALYGRNGESPMVVIAASSPSNCFDYSFVAAKIAVEHMTPVLLLTDGYIANGSEPWKIVKTDDLPTITPHIAKANTENFQPFDRNQETLVREWAFPGTEGLEHHVGGLEKDNTGNVSYDPKMHDIMVKIRAEKVKKIAKSIPKLKIDGAQEGDLLVVGWGGTYGSLLTAVNSLHSDGKKIGLAHFNYINPLPENVAEVFGKFKKIVVAELNLGQFASYLRSELPGFTYTQYNKVQGLPFSVIDLISKFDSLLK